MSIFTAKAQVSQSEFDALVALYNATNGASWTDNSNWNVTTGTKDDVTSDWYGLSVTSGHVRSIHLNNNNLSGTIPTTLGDLELLQNLYLYENQLTGAIPTSIENITYLRQLKLNDNQLTGNIPSEIGNLLSLEKIMLHNNQLSGSIPIEIGNLTKLKWLLLKNNQFTGNIPSEIGNLSKIYSMSLNDNNFSGSIPEEIGMLTTLKYLFLQDNELTGDFPDQIQSVTQLIQLQIHNNNITSLPDLTDLPLTWLKISDNNLTFGDIETNFSKLSCDQCLYSPQAKVGKEQNLYATIGSDITISVNVDGNHNTYQWYKGTSTLITGAENASYTISNFQLADERTYYCKIENTVATALTLQSNDIVISSSAIPVITTHAVTLDDFCANGTAIFSIEDNYGETYQWQEKSPSGNWQDITNATDWTGYDTQSISSVQANIQYLNGYSYRCIVTNPNDSETSTAAILNTDSENPELTVQDFTLELDATGNAILEASDVIISVSDNCTIDETILSKTIFDCSNIGIPVTIDVSVTDISGNNITKQANITAVDNVDPVLSVQNYTLELDAAGNATLQTTNVITASSDNCAVDQTSLSKTAFDCSNIGAPVTVDVTLSDESGNETTEQVTITVVDNINPTLNVQNYTLELDATGNAILKASDVVTSATDNCTLADTTLSQTEFDCSNIETPVNINVTLSDESGNDVTKQATITVLDNVDPVLSVQNHTLQLDADGNATLKLSNVVISASDNCELADTTLSQTDFDCANIATPVTVAVTLSDESGNETIEQITITIKDNVDPVLSVQDYTLELDASGNATLLTTNVVTATSDNCATNQTTLSKTDFDCSNIGTPVAVDVILSDESGNETTKQSTITVVDNVDPALSIQNYTIELDAAGNATLKASDIVTSTSDNCEIADTTLSKSDFNCANIGTPMNVDVTLSDESGNDVTKQATITVVDNIDPVLIVQNHTLQLDAEGNATLKPTDVVLSTSDNCELADTTLSKINFDCTNVGTPITVDVTLSDESGNETTEQVTITVEDHVDPVLSLQNHTLELDASGNASLQTSDVVIATSDNCAVDQTTLSKTDFDCSNIGTPVTIDVTLSDESGNEVTEWSVITVVDKIVPGLHVQNYTLELDATGNATLEVSDVITSATDNCSVASITLSKTAFDCSNIGTPVTVDATVADESGNNITKQAIVTIVDHVDPVLSVRNHTLQLNADGDATLQLTDVVIGASDNCELSDTVISQINFDCANIGTPVTVDITLTDASENTVTGQATITVEDNINPEIISTHNDKTITDEGNCETTLPDYTATLIAQDNCDASLTITQFPTAGTIISGQIPVTLTAIDNSGNEADVTFNLYVDDITNPELTVKNFILQLNEQGNATLLASDVVTKATDNCTLADTTLSKSEFNCSNIGTPVQVDVTLYDAIGNEVTKQVTITVEDNIDPVLSVQDHTIYVDENGSAKLKLNDVVIDATDNCSIADTTLSQTDFNCSNIGTPVTVDLTLTDESGNEVSVQVTITVEDNIDPEVPVLDDISEECSVTVTVPTTTDNCADVILATTDNPLTYDTQGEYTIIWNFDDGNGNNIDMVQNIFINDVTIPTIECRTDTTINLSQGESIYTVQATKFDPVNTSDNCNVASIANDFNNNASLKDAELPTGTTTITWTVTDDAGNTKTCSYDLTVNIASGTNNTTSSNGIKVYPNPASDFIKIESNHSIVNQIDIFDVTGKLVKNSMINGNLQSIDISDLYQGIYFINIKANNTSQVFKLIKK